MEDLQTSTTERLDITLQLDAFEGPLDLLLHLIREQDIDIFDIPVHQIAEEFQAYVEMIQRIDLDRAGDYLAMAAELTQIKSKMLLPRAEEKEEEDPRQELVEKLLEYEQIQKATNYLQDRELLNRDVFRRGVDPCMGLPRAPMKTSPVASDSLVFVFQDMLHRRLQRIGAYHPVKREHVSVRQRIVWLCNRLHDAAQSSLRFSELLESIEDRVTIIATFLALLELGRLRRIRLTQNEERTDLVIEAVGTLEDIPLQDVASFANTEESDELFEDIDEYELN